MTCHATLLTGRRTIGVFALLAVGWTGTPAPAVAQQARPTLTLDAVVARLRHLEDTQDITNVLVAYGRALDSRDFKAYSSLFAKDGSWSGGMGSVSGGPQAVYDFMTSRVGGGRATSGGTASATAGGRQGAGGGPGSTYHIMSNFKIEITGDNATASSRWTFVSAARGPGIQLAGRYEDTLVREDGAWKFKSRQAFNDVTAPAAASSAAGAPSPTAPGAGQR